MTSTNEYHHAPLPVPGLPTLYARPDMSSAATELQSSSMIPSSSLQDTSFQQSAPPPPAPRPKTNSLSSTTPRPPPPSQNAHALARPPSAQPAFVPSKPSPQQRQPATMSFISMNSPMSQSSTPAPVSTPKNNRYEGVNGNAYGAAQVYPNGAPQIYRVGEDTLSV